MRLFILLMLAMCIAIPAAQARPVSYPGGWTAMFMNDGFSNSMHIHYSPTAWYSVGYKLDYRRDLETTIHAVQTNFLLNRWNQQDSQANIYLKTGAGIADADNEQHAAGFAGVAADWEDRRFLVAYENRVQALSTIDESFSQSARIGVAPYIGEYGDLHTWMILQVSHDPEGDKHFRATPTLRLFKGDNLVEAGVDTTGDITFNFVHRF